jgi:hypothetical protein
VMPRLGQSFGNSSVDGAKVGSRGVSCLSCEYRFYLKASSSLAWNRLNTLVGMWAIFHR